MNSNLSVWCILVPTLKAKNVKNKFFTTKHHKVWDEYVRKISGGLTIFAPGKGQWISPKNGLIEERIIPVNVACSEDDFKKIIKFTINHYEQEAIMAYKISDEVYIISANEVN